MSLDPFQGSDVLRQVDLTLVANATCNTNIGVDNDVTDNDLCAGELTASQSNCFGDSGGPFVTKNSQGSYTLIGGVSRGPSIENAACKSYSIYAHVAKQATWIQQQIGDTNTTTPTPTSVATATPNTPVR